MRFLVVLLLVLLLIVLLALSRWARIRANEQAARRSGQERPSGPPPGS